MKATGLHLPDLAAVAHAVSPSVVQVSPDHAGGAGVVFTMQQGPVIVTNAHLARGALGSWIHIVAASGAVHSACVERRDPRRDLAVLRLTSPPNPLSLNGEGDLSSPPNFVSVNGEGDLLVPAQVGDLTTVRPGHLVMAVGHPFGLANAVTAGVVHSIGPLRGQIELPAGRGELPWIQADIHLAPGNSGGPLCDTAGRVLGINTMIMGGLALAVPIDEILAFLNSEEPMVSF